MRYVLNKQSDMVQNTDTKSWCSVNNDEYLDWLTKIDLNTGLPNKPDPCILPSPSVSEIKSSLASAVQNWLDSEAQAIPYLFDNIGSASSYVNDKNPIFAARGQFFKDLRSDSWTYCDVVEADVNAQSRPVPTPTELVAELKANFAALVRPA